MLRAGECFEGRFVSGGRTERKNLQLSTQQVGDGSGRSGLDFSKPTGGKLKGEAELSRFTTPAEMVRNCSQSTGGKTPFSTTAQTEYLQSSRKKFWFPPVPLQKDPQKPTSQEAFGA